MFEQFQNHIATHFTFLQDKKLLLAVSGGIDSVVLVHLFKKLNLNIAIAHCNFQLRGVESNEDAQFVENLAKSSNIPFYNIAFETEKYAKKNKVSIQVAARELRYTWFDTLLEQEKYHYVITAHHLDDQVETFLLNFTRGTGLEGLLGIPEINDKIIRPLLPFSREEIEKYATKNTIIWREDSSNISDKYFRNKLRHHIIPVLKELNPTFLSSFQNTVAYLEQDAALATDATASFYNEAVVENDTIVKILIPKLKTKPNYNAYLHKWLKPYGFTAWDDIYNLILAQSGKKVLSETHTLLKDRETLLLYKNKVEDENNFFFIMKSDEIVKTPLKLLITRVNTISETTNNAIFVDEDKVTFPLKIRKKQIGDFFFPSGMQGKKKLSKFFKDEKYSLLEKETQWLLTSNGAIVWVFGKRADSRFMVSEQTLSILKIEISE